MSIKYVTGDLITLLDNKGYDLVIHGCNCHNVWARGLSLKMKESFPEAYKADLKTVKGDRGKLGRFSRYSYPNLIVVNAYTQYDYGNDDAVCYTDYIALRNVFKLIHKAASSPTFKGKSISMPMIGCGSGGADWRIVEGIINTIFNDIDITVVKYDKSANATKVVDEPKPAKRVTVKVKVPKKKPTKKKKVKV